jgi:hypothetical protein
MAHPLQTDWYDERVEKDYASQIEALVHAGELDAAAEKLLADIALLDTPIADMCRSLTADKVKIEGWDDIEEAIVNFEGDPITAVHVVISNEADLVFEDKSLMQEPLLEVVFYTDEYQEFSALSRAELLDESLREMPDWYGASEDIEAYLEITGFGPLNTALIQHKRQYFFRDSVHILDEKSGLAGDSLPIAYVEFCLAAMFRAVRYHQAVKAQVEAHGLPGNVPVIAGMFNMKPAIGSVYVPSTVKVVEVAKVAKLAVVIKRNMEDTPLEVAGSSLRQFISEEPEEKPGFWKRLFGRR